MISNKNNSDNFYRGRLLIDKYVVHPFTRHNMQYFLSPPFLKREGREGRGEGRIYTSVMHHIFID